MRPLLIGEAEKATIARLREKATTNVIDAVSAMKESPQALRDKNAGQTIELPVGFRVTYTIERQPLGLFRHLSVSVDAPAKGPNPAAVEMILEEFGMEPVANSAECWVEYFSPQDYAVNILQPLVNREGHA